ncbi:hypothetical protein [Desulfitobacterium dehalogenans]|uniref:hypothetical protein n=1 Tax=Desulfitobacterium dehalogenans TaxID=36854 RepID=UPI001FA7D412|nr:hypothetical protein [Desulfitobacterium dehalogenans]
MNLIWGWHLGFGIENVTKRGGVQVISLINSFQKMNRIGRVGAFIGLAASVSGIILWAILNIFKEVLPITFVGLGLPAILGLVASIYGVIWLMYVVFIYSLPLSLYLVMTPSAFRPFLLVSLGYLASAILLTLDRRARDKDKLN